MIERVIVEFVQTVRNAFAAVLRAVGLTVARRPHSPTHCDDGGTVPCGANPRQCGSSQATVFGPIGGLAAYPQCGTGPRTLLRTQAGFTGLDAAARTELRFASAPVVTIEVVHFSNDPAPGRVEALQGGSVADMRPLAPTPGVAQQFTLSGTAIDRLVVTPRSPSDVTIVLRWCH
jgi:hypothetical protein